MNLTRHPNFSRLLCAVLALTMLCAALPAYAQYKNLSMDMKDDAANGPIQKMQQALMGLGFELRDTGYYDVYTHQAVVGFQERNGLTITGVADAATQKAIFTPGAKGYATPVAELPEGAGKEGGVDAGSVQLLRWYRDVKPKFRQDQRYTVYHPGSGIRFTLRILDLNTHADSEPNSYTDTRLMNRAFGGRLSWAPVPVYVQVPGTGWVLATMHNYPHGSNWVVNGFGGHLCVHFLRDIEETKKTATASDYHLSHQKAIRLAWKSMTGQDLGDMDLPQEQPIVSYLTVTRLEPIAQSLSSGILDGELTEIARSFSYQMLTQGSYTNSQPGITVIASAQTEEAHAAAALLANNPAIRSADYIGIGGVMTHTIYPQQLREEVGTPYWFAVGMTAEAYAAAFPGKPLYGDVTDDKKINLDDLMSLVDYLVNGTACNNMVNANVDRDPFGIVDQNDLLALVNLIVK